MKGMVFDLLLRFFLATMITQPTPNTRIQKDVGYKSLSVVHCLTHRMPYSVAIEHHRNSDEVEAMQPRESKF